MVRTALNVVARHRLNATPDTVFRALTDPKYMTRWFSPSEDIGTVVAEQDLREGGRYRLGFVFPEGNTVYVVGEYREISPPEKLVYTWTWEEPDQHAGIETLVTMELHREKDQTELVVTHEMFPDAATRDRHDEGWHSTLERLAHVVQTLGPTDT